MQALIGIVRVIGLVGLVIKALVHFIGFVLVIVFIALAAVFLPRVIRHILKERYFASEKFFAHKADRIGGRGAQ
jgi:hypothetical protein